jgi:hypothetical protein
LSAPDQVVVDPLGRDVYVASGASVDLFRRDDLTGNLTFVSCVGPGSGCDGSHVNGIADLAIAPQGDNLYGSSTSSDGKTHELDSWDRDPQSGALSNLRCIANTASDAPCALDPNELTDQAGYVAATPDGADVIFQGYDASTASATLAVYARASGTGSLSLAQCL